MSLIFLLLSPLSYADDPKLHPEWEESEFMEVRFEELSDADAKTLKKRTPWIRPHGKIIVQAKEFLEVLGVPDFATYLKSHFQPSDPRTDYLADLSGATDQAIAKIYLSKILDEAAYRRNIEAEVSVDRFQYAYRSGLLTLLEIRKALLSALRAEGKILTEAEQADLDWIEGFLGDPKPEASRSEKYGKRYLSILEKTNPSHGPVAAEFADLQNAAKLGSWQRMAWDPAEGYRDALADARAHRELTLEENPEFTELNRIYTRADLSKTSMETWSKAFEVVKRFREKKKDAVVTRWIFHCVDLPSQDYGKSVGIPYGLKGSLFVRHRLRLRTLCEANAKEGQHPLDLDGRASGYLVKDLFDPERNGNFRVPVQFDELDLGGFIRKIRAVFQPMYDGLIRDRAFGQLFNEFLSLHGGFKRWASEFTTPKELRFLYEQEMAKREAYRKAKSIGGNPPPPQTAFDESEYELSGIEAEISAEDREAFLGELANRKAEFETSFSSWMEAEGKRIQALPDAERIDAQAVFFDAIRSRLQDGRTAHVKEWMEAAAARVGNHALLENVQIRRALRDGVDLSKLAKLEPLSAARIRAYHPIFDGARMLGQFEGSLGVSPSVLPIAIFTDPVDKAKIRILAGIALTQQQEADGLPSVLGFSDPLAQRIALSQAEEKFRLFAQRELVYGLFEKNPMKILLATPWLSKRVPEIAIWPVSPRMRSPAVLANELIKEIPYEGKTVFHPSVQDGMRFRETVARMVSGLWEVLNIPATRGL